MGCLMFVGTYTTLFESSVNPWTTLGPLAVIISISLCQEAASDRKRHQSDHKTNHAPCVVLRRAEDTDADGAERDPTIMNGKDIDVKILKQQNKDKTPVKRSSRKTIPKGRPNTAMTDVTEKMEGPIVGIAFQNVKRMDIRAGDIVLVKNREMIPADIILLGSSGENGSAYIETSPIDGETNLKLRKSPHLPTLMASTPGGLGAGSDQYVHPRFEQIDRAVKRLTRFSLLGHPNAKSALLNPNNKGPKVISDEISSTVRKQRRLSLVQQSNTSNNEMEGNAYVATITTEPPNASVNTFSGKIVLPPPYLNESSIEIPLDAENILLRGAMLRNTEWVLGVACFTGDDTKLARNSINTPSKFSGLDELMNRTVILILFIMLFCVLVLSTSGFFANKAEFDSLWYAGFAVENTPWPYMKIDGKPVYPSFRTEPPGFHQFMFTNITLLNNFIPFSLYVTVEMITLFMMFLIGWDKSMYHEDTDTAAVARSTTVADLGQVKYVFSDKTGTLTQNVMRFKRCSVDGSIFGEPVVKVNPGGEDEDTDYDDEVMRSKYHELKQLLIGTISLNAKDEADDEAKAPDIINPNGNTLTFNAEMFLRVMSICHTVVVEKEIDASNINRKSERPAAASFLSWVGNRSRTNTTEDAVTPLSSIKEANSLESSNINDINDKISTLNESTRTIGKTSVRTGKSNDGSPIGYAYQAESPDEGALVSAASLDFGFQLISRDSDGVKLACSSRSLLSIDEVAKGLKSGTMTPKTLAAETACPRIGTQPNHMKTAFEKFTAQFSSGKSDSTIDTTEEVWSILAVNKFDSTRKRMSVLVRSPASLGSIPMLLIKGADSSMLDPDVCEGGEYITSGALGGERMSSLINQSSSDYNDSNEWEKSVLLNMQSQLGIFASEGLRTLVLGIRVLTETDCEAWLAKYKIASTAIENREERLTAVALEIERNIHIVGSTAIEDKLQDGVPETIHNIARAGIKLWVLTGDKRETAIEIGYSTKVLNPKMHLTDVADGNTARVKALIAMEFIRLVKIGKLAMYQRNAKQKKSKLQRYCSPIMVLFEYIGKVVRMISRFNRRFYYFVIVSLCGTIKKDYLKQQLGRIQDEVDKEGQKEKGRHAKVRDLAETILKEYKLTKDYAEESGMKQLKTARNFSPKGGIEDEDETTPEVFHRASNANTVLDIRHGSLNAASLRGLSLMALEQSDNIAPNVESQPVIDNDVMSMKSEIPEQKQGNIIIFNKKKRTILERLFAVDRDVRKGKLVKHLTKEKRQEYFSPYSIMNQTSMGDIPDGINTTIDRALVIEGSALVHFLGNPLLEELLFAVASSCESVIACRVSPKQKALLVKLVKQFVVPTPVTLAIGDGANDVGMIQEAQVGVGISGLEGQQAVNSSDFAIAQFRFLEDLLLVHGRWNFMRLSKTVLFSFYKNAVLAGLLIVFSRETLYSGEPLMDQWAISSFNIVNGFGILLFGMFDRDIDKDYVKQNPILYATGPNNEHFAMRVTFRWICLVLLHVNLIYFLTDICVSGGSTQSSAFKGLMTNSMHPGDGDGGDLKVYGTVIFVILNWVLALKVLYESGSIIHGKWPALLGCCKKGVEGFWSRIAYTWHGIAFLCIGFNYFFIYLYQVSFDSGRCPLYFITNVSNNCFLSFKHFNLFLYDCRNLVNLVHPLFRHSH